MVFVCGHQNPDTDSIVAAIAYARLKEQGTAQAVRLGELSPETRYVLERFSFQAPPLLTNARTQIKDIDIDYSPSVPPDTAVSAAWEIMKAGGIITLLVTDRKNRLLGIVSPGDIAEAVLREVFSGSRHDTALEQLRQHLAGGALTVDDIMKKSGLITFTPEDYVDQVRSHMLATRYRAYPVLDRDGCVVGVISRFHLIHHRRKQLILVDHNEKSQSVPGLEHAEILEIIDHHRLGDIQTGAPMFFHNEPVGSTTTIVAGMFHEAGKCPPPDLAGLMLAGILSDTVLYKSPICVDKDRRMAAWLSDLSGIDDRALGRELFHAFDAQLQNRTPQQFFFHNFKEYTLGGKKIGIGQITVWSTDAVPLQAIQSYMHSLRASERFDLLLFMQTEVVRGGTLFLHSCGDPELLHRCFGVEGGKPFFLAGTMSRTKQILPVLSKALL